MNFDLSTRKAKITRRYILVLLWNIMRVNSIIRDGFLRFVVVENVHDFNF